MQDGPGEQDRRDRVERAEHGDDADRAACRRDRDQGVGARVEDADREDERPRRAAATRGTVRVHASTMTSARDRAEPCGRGRPRSALLRGLAEPDDEQPEAEGGHQREADAGRDSAASVGDRAAPGSRETRTTPISASAIPSHCTAAGERPRGRRRRPAARPVRSPRSAPRCPSRRSPCRGRGIRARRRPTMPAPRASRTPAPGRVGAGQRDPDDEPQQADELRPEEDDQDRHASRRRGRRRSRRYPTAPPRRAPAPPLPRCSVLADGPGRRLGVELIRVIEHRSLGRAGRLPVVVDGDRVQELAPDVGCRGRVLAPRSAAGRDGRVRADDLPPSGGTTVRGPSSAVRPTSCRSALASSRSWRRRGWS